MFGTSGVRGPVGEAVTADLTLDVGRALATDGAETVVIGRDARDSGAMLALALDVGRALATDGRIRPLTDHRPNALVPVGDRPPRYRTWGSSSSSSRTSTLADRVPRDERQGVRLGKPRNFVKELRTEWSNYLLGTHQVSPS